MFRALKNPVAVVFLVLAAGCAGPREVYVVDDSGRAVSDASIAQNLVAGSYVQIELKTGEKLSGNVRQTATDGITLDRPRDYSFKERLVPIEDIAKLKVLEESGGRAARFSWPIVGTLIVVGVAAAAMASIRIGE